MYIHTDIDREAWQRLVQESRTGTWFQSPEAYAFYASMPAILKPYVIAVSEGTQLRGVCVVYVTRESNPVRQYFTRRAIITGGPCLADDATEAEVESLMRAVREQVQAEAIYIETRNFNDYSRWRNAFEAAGFAYKKHLNFHVDCTEEAAMTARLSENRKRQIKKAKAVGTVVSCAQTEQEIHEWYAILKELYRTKVKTPLWPLEFFIEAYRQGAAAFLLVRDHSKIIGGSMIVILHNRCVYEWFECGLNAAYKEHYPSVMATCAGLQYAHEHGCPRYDMMGAGEPGVPYGVRDFKSEFGGVQVEHGRFLCICHSLLYRLGETIVRKMKS
jgi:lipid II:glycine glycyltransferase (peptidoglycan interpeptide bridge formation enzyme)